MGIELPHSLDLPVRTLRRRIIKAFDYSQALTELFGTNGGPGVRSLKPYTSKNDIDLKEGMALYTGRPSVANGINAFEEVRFTIPEIVASGYEFEGVSEFVLVDVDGMRSIKLKVSTPLHPHQ